MSRTEKSPLQQIPGVGPNMAKHLHTLGYTSVAELRGQNPRELYERDCLSNGTQLDRCVLYVYRCAVYFAENDAPEPEKCNWWYWKDRPFSCE